MKNIYLLYIMCLIVLAGCKHTKEESKDSEGLTTVSLEAQNDSVLHNEIVPPIEITIKEDVPVRSYFKWMDSLVTVQNQKNNYTIDEYIIVHFNKWIIDTLAHTDYYYLSEKGIFSEDPQSLIVLKKDQTLFIPDSIQTLNLKKQLGKTYIDLNIPEFRLRIVQNGKELYKFPVRVGQNNKRYLAMAKREVDMRTKPGIGEIVRVNKFPVFINPKDNHRYNVTRRDDGKITKLPGIPWIEPTINGVRLGQLIHPTTNMATLNKASSNGCVGLRESDAWYVYYYAPLGTKVIFRYDLQVKNENGQVTQLDNIYPGFEKIKVRTEALVAAAEKDGSDPLPICDCRTTN